MNVLSNLSSSQLCLSYVLFYFQSQEKTLHEESHAHQSLQKLMVWPQKQTFLTSQKVTCIHAWPHVGLSLDVCVHFLKDETGARWGKNLYPPHVSHISGFVREPCTTDRPQSEMRSTSKTPKDTSICPKMCR